MGANLRPDSRKVVPFKLPPFVRLLTPSGIDDFLAHFRDQNCMICLHDHEHDCITMVRIKDSQVTWLYNEFPVTYETAVRVLRKEAEAEGLTADRIHFFTGDTSIPIFDQGEQA